MKKKILIVTDEQALQLALQNRLIYKGFHTETINTGAEMVDKVRMEPPDLVLIDIKLQGTIDGIEAAKQIREITDIPLILLSEASDDDAIERAIEIKPEGLLIKPVNETELIAAIKVAIARYKAGRLWEVKYRALFEKMTHGVVYHDSNGRIISLNPAALNILGIEDGQVSGQSRPESDWKIIQEDGSDFDENNHPVGIALKEGKCVENVFMGISNPRKGHDKWLKISAIPLFASNEKRPYQVFTTIEDITELKKKAIENQKMSQILEGIEQNLPVAIMRVDKDGRFTELRGIASRKLGKGNDQIIGTDALKPDNIISNGVRNALNGGSSHFEYTHYSDGNLVCFEDWFFYDKANNGGAIGFSLEITEKKNIQQKLVESEDRYRRLVEMSPDVIVVQCEGKIVYINETGIRVYGAESEDELIGHSILKFIHPDYRDLIVAKSTELMQYGRILPFFEVKYIAKSGEILDFEIAGIPTIFKEKPAIQVIARNIGDRKKAENALRLSEERFRAVFENSPVGIAISQNWRIIEVNPAYVKMFGFCSSTEMINTSILDRVPERYRTSIIERYDKKIKGEIYNNSFETWVIKKDGTEFPVHIETSAINFQNGTAGVSLVSDITESKNQEEYLKSSLKEKNTLLKEIHHRVKNNLQIITSLLSLQSDFIEDEKSLELFRESISRVRTMALIHERLYQTDSLSKIDIADYTEGLSEYLFSVYNVTVAKVRLEIQFEQVFLNVDRAIPYGLLINELISNSLKHAFPGSRNGNIIISLETANDYYNLKISDDGIGLPENLDLNNVKSLGLLLVSSLVSQLNGNFEWYNAGGAHFVIKFPK